MSDNPLMAYVPKKSSNPLMAYLPAQETAPKKYARGERSAIGNIFERPGAAVRSAILGGFKPGSYAKGANVPEEVPMFQDVLLDKYYKAPDFAGKEALGYGVSALGMAGDIATSPADLATILAPKVPGAARVAKMIGGTKPAKAIGQFMTKERHLTKTAPQLEKQAVDIYRQVLRPTAGEVKTIEIKKRGSIRDPLTIAAEEKLPIGVSKEGGVNKLDTTAARKTVSARIDELDTKLSDTLKATKKTQPYIDLTDIRKQAKAQARKSIANDTEYNAYAKDIDQYIDDAIAARGRYVSGSDLNEIKRGMYSTGYNAMNPTSDKAARIVGRVAKNKIEKAYTGKNVKQINDTMGKYLTLQKLLENAQGRVVAGGRIGKYVAQGIGAGLGAAAGGPLPVIGPLMGGMIGREAGKKAYSIASNPSRLATKAASLAGKAGISERALRGALSGSTSPVPSYRRGVTRGGADSARLLAVLADKFGIGNR